MTEHAEHVDGRERQERQERPLRVLSLDVGIRNMSFADISFADSRKRESARLVNWGVIDVTGGHSQGKGTNAIDGLSTQVLEALRDNFSEHCYDHVIIENQPVIKNPAMKTIQIIMYTYFQTTKMLFGSVQDVRFVSAALKLREMQEGGEQTGNSTTKKMTYAERKALSVKTCRALLAGPLFSTSKQNNDNNNDSVVAVFEGSKKKDDLADALLQAMAFHTVYLTQ